MFPTALVFFISHTYAYDFTWNTESPGQAAEADENNVSVFRFSISSIPFTASQTNFFNLGSYS